MTAIVSEMYSPPIATETIKMMPRSGVLAGFVIDLTTRDTDGRALNFDGEEMRQRARNKQDTEKPMFLIGSPPCVVYSPLRA